MNAGDYDDEVFLSNEIGTELDSDLWSSPLMNYTSPFDDYKDLFADIDASPAPKSRSTLSSTTSAISPVSPYRSYGAATAPPVFTFGRNHVLLYS